MKVILLIFILFFLKFTLFSQSNACGAGTTTLTPGIPCTLTNGNTANSNSTIGISCGLGNPDDDEWYKFVATGFNHTITIDGAANFDAVIGVFSDCIGTVVPGGNCVDATGGNGIETIVLSNLNIGFTYFINVYDFGNGGGDFQICISTPVIFPVNDECSGATSVAVSSGSCNYTTGSISFATASPQANTCSGTADDDVWYFFTATSPSVTVHVTNISGSTTNLNHSVYSGTCGALGLALNCSDPNTSILNGLTIGNNYFLRVYSSTATAGQSAQFDVCIQNNGICGTPTTQDYCTAPAQLVEGVGNFAANTSGSYTQDIPANLFANFCGSIENNSWFQFTATTTTEVFNFTTVTPTYFGSCPNGIQAVVLEVTEDVNGCCTNFNDVSNCWEPGNASGGVVTATGLTIGNQYMLMVDGNTGSICDFIVSGWTATGIIPLGVEYKHFFARKKTDFKELIWETNLERDCDYYDVLRSFDGFNFEQIGMVSGNGTKLTPSNYLFIDKETRFGEVFYKLRQVDFNGASKETETLILNRELRENILVYPNPSENEIQIEFKATNETHITIYSINGTLVQEIFLTEKGEIHEKIIVSALEKGLYFIKIENETINETKSFTKI